MKKPTSKEAEPSSQLDAKVPSPESCTFTRRHSCTSSLVREVLAALLTEFCNVVFPIVIVGVSSFRFGTGWVMHLYFLLHYLVFGDFPFCVLLVVYVFGLYQHFPSFVSIFGQFGLVCVPQVYAAFHKKCCIFYFATIIHFN